MTNKPVNVHQVLALEQVRRQAMLAGDIDALRDLLAPDVRYVHSTGVSDTRESLLAKLSGGAMHYLQLEFEHLHITALTDAAVISGTMSAQVARNDTVRTIAASYLAFWSLDSAVWQLRALQSTALPPAIP